MLQYFSFISFRFLCFIMFYLCLPYIWQGCGQIHFWLWYFHNCCCYLLGFDYLSVVLVWLWPEISHFVVGLGMARELSCKDHVGCMNMLSEKNVLKPITGTEMRYKNKDCKWKYVPNSRWWGWNCVNSQCNSQCISNLDDVRDCLKDTTSPKKH